MVFKDLDKLRDLYSQKSLYQSLSILVGLQAYFIWMFIYNSSHPYILSFSVGSVIFALMIGIIYIHFSGLKSIDRMEQLNILACKTLSNIDRRSLIKLEIDNT